MKVKDLLRFLNGKDPEAEVVAELDLARTMIGRRRYQSFTSVEKAVDGTIPYIVLGSGY